MILIHPQTNHLYHRQQHPNNKDRPSTIHILAHINRKPHHLLLVSIILQHRIILIVRVSRCLHKAPPIHRRQEVTHRRQHRHQQPIVILQVILRQPKVAQRRKALVSFLKYGVMDFFQKPENFSRELKTSRSSQLLQDVTNSLLEALIQIVKRLKAGCVQQETVFCGKHSTVICHFSKNEQIFLFLIFILLILYRFFQLFLIKPECVFLCLF